MLNKAYFEITNVCNLSCAFCHKTSRPKRFMSEDEFEFLTDKLQNKIQYLYFHLMGEPTLHPSLPLFIRRAREKGFFPMLTTNGSLLPKVSGALLEDLPHKISISLHDAAANPAFANVDYLECCADFARHASQLGCITVLRLWNLGSEDEKTNSSVLSYLKSVFTDEWKSVRNGGGYKLADKLFIEYGERFDWPDQSETASDENADAFCYGLRDQIGILVDGTVVPCCLDADGVLSLGNLFSEDLDSVLNSPRARAIYDGFTMRRAAEELCRKCPYARRFAK